MEDEEQSREWNSLMEVTAKSRILAVRGVAGSGLPVPSEPSRTGPGQSVSHWPPLEVVAVAGPIDAWDWRIGRPVAAVEEALKRVEGG